MATIARSERATLCSLLEDKGPLAPTLCEGWTTSDLAAHLFVREYRPLASPGIMFTPFAGLTERAMESAKRELGYAGLIDRIRDGPPLPWKLVDEAVNSFEYFVHHEDVRRAADADEAMPRQDAELDAALWANLKRGARLMAWRLRGAGLELIADGFGSVSAKQATPLVTVSGGPQELTLFLFGRKGAARVTIDGPDAARGIVENASFGF
jgi:uncharacterized protein (TIGR03085 family)